MISLVVLFVPLRREFDTFQISRIEPKNNDKGKDKEANNEDGENEEKEENPHNDSDNES